MTLTKKSPLGWSRYFEPFFSSEDLQDPNISHSLIALVKIKDRVFALTFGHGSYAIKRNLLEPRFGLKCTLNLADPFQINTLDTRNIDLVAQQRRIHVSAGRSFPEFEIDPLVDWVGYVAGRTDGRGLIRNVAGADSVSITTEASFAELGEICVKLLEAFYSDEYKEKYPFVDYLSPLPKDDPVIKTLDNQVFDLLGEQRDQRLSLAYPEMPDFERLDRIKVWQGSRKLYMDDLSLSGIYEFFRMNPDERDPRKISVLALDENEQPVIRKHSLWDYLVCEVEQDGRTYVLSLGEWFSADSSFVERLRREISQIPDLTADMAMPEMAGDEREKDYNERVSQIKNWLLLDKQTVTVSEPYGKVEVCDLVTRDLQFIAVKKMTSSATLSHLFSQGLVSARLMKSDPRYKHTVINQISTKWPDVDHTTADARMFIFAIATEKTGDLGDSMFLFSQINLAEQRRSIEQMGYRVGLCKIPKGKPTIRQPVRSKKAKSRSPEGDLE